MHREESGAGDIETELSGLPDFLTEDKEVRDKIINWQVDWLKNLRQIRETPLITLELIL